MIDLSEAKFSESWCNQTPLALDVIYTIVLYECLTAMFTCSQNIIIMVDISNARLID